MAIFLLPSVSAWILPSKTYDAQEKTYSLSAGGIDGLGGLWKVADVKWIDFQGSFIDYSFTRKFIFYDDVLPSEYGLDYYDKSGKIAQYGLIESRNVLVTYKDVEVNDYDECKTTEKYCYKDNQTLQDVCRDIVTSTTCVTGKHTEKQEVLTDIDMSKTQFKAGQEYIIRTYVKKKPSTNIDLIENFDGYVMDAWVWMNSTFQKKKPMYIKEMSGSAITGYPVNVTVIYDTDMQADWSDIRFSNAAEDTELGFWLAENYGTSALFYINISSSASTNNTFYMYYKNSTAVTSKSSFARTFAWGDDFDRPDNTTIGPSPLGNIWSETGTAIEILGNRLHFNATDNSGGSHISTSFGNQGQPFEMFWKWEKLTSANPAIKVLSSADGNVAGVWMASGAFAVLSNDGWYALDTPTTAFGYRNYTTSLVPNNVTGSFKTFINGTEKSDDVFFQPPLTPNKVKMGNDGLGDTSFFVDYIFNRTYLTTQPSVSFGDEIDNILLTTDLNYPANLLNSSINSIIFSCNSTALGATLKNVSLYLYAPDNSVFTTITQALSGTFATTTWNLSEIPDNTYKWNCLTWDTTSTYSDWDVNRTLYVDTLLNVSLISPPDNTVQTINSATFICSANTTATRLVNNTLSILYKVNNSLYYNNTQTVSNASSKFQWSLTNIPDGNYTWNCNAWDNASNTEWGVNRTLKIDILAPYVRIDYPSATVFNAFTQPYNASLNNTILDSNLDTCYFNTSESSVKNIFSGNKTTFNISKQGSGTVYVYCNDTFGNTNSTSANYTIHFEKLGFCNATYNKPAFNITFWDETYNNASNSTIDSLVIDYTYDGSYHQSFSYVNTVANASDYGFCLWPNSTANLSLSYNISYTGFNSPQRSLNGLSSTLLNSTVIEKKLYTLPTANGLYVTFQVINPSLSPLSDVTLTISRLIASVSQTIAVGTTDSSGAVTFWLNPLVSHTIDAVKTGYVTYSASITPSQSAYTITMNSLTATNVTDTISGITYYITPITDQLNKTTAYTFSFSITDSNSNLDSYGFNITNSTGSILYSTTGSAAGGSNLSTSLSTGLNTAFVMKAYYSVDGEKVYLNKQWNIYNMTSDQYSLNRVFTDLKTYTDAGMFGINAFSLTLIIFIIIFISTGILCYNFGIYSPAAITGLIFGETALFDVGLHLITNPIGAIAHFPTIFVGLILVAFIIREATSY